MLPLVLDAGAGQHDVRLVQIDLPPAQRGDLLYAATRHGDEP
ncbi:hypothetical protein XfCFBP8356_005635 [Xylella fastidiosa subsp. sandyi]|nr:hypothetical protein [Xylella fastidiosa]KAF0570487.1 hypothetical protein P305_09555 [Xylella fastidiosa subsp. fastidiosa Mus-1]AIC13891.1 hypothetical protein P303_07850 [Xylella fastidiosa MUL0034]AIC13926.1 hypothetical protein P303_08100 [Xylella fastidiosa MUL0034]WCF16818.1 hypothetical protein OK116_08835 [Xylella fastidiosa subsp. fastidiosa]WCF19004.1 hypothetical protein OK118_08635 [Xylella fastidiosa subsp. fastidiosa]